MMHRLRVEEKEKRPQKTFVESHGEDVSAYRRTPGQLAEPKPETSPTSNRLFPNTKFTEDLPEQFLGIDLSDDFSDGVKRAPELNGDELW